MKSCWINSKGKIECTCSVYCYDVIRPEESSYWATKGRYVPLSEGLSDLFEGLVYHRQPNPVIVKMNKLIQLDIEWNKLNKCVIMRRRFFEFEVVRELIRNEAESLEKHIKENRLYFDRIPKGVSDNLPILSSNHGISSAILKELQEKKAQPEIVIVVDGHFDFHAYLTIARIGNFAVDKHIDKWGKMFNSRQELVAFLQAHKDKESSEVCIPINRVAWLKNCFFSMPYTLFIHIGADWMDTRFSSNQIMRRVYKMNIYPHLYNDLIKWSENDFKIREFRRLIRDRTIYLSIDVDGVAGIPSTISLAEPTRRNQISKRLFATILRNCAKYARDFKFDISELTMHRKESVTKAFLKHIFVTL